MPGLLFAIGCGWLAGMLVNYLSDVLPVHRRLGQPACLECGTGMAALNYFLTPRRCPACGTARPWRTLIVEVVLAVASAWVWVYTPDRMSFAASLALLTYFAVVVVIDLEHRLIMHVVSIGGALLCALIGFQLHGLRATLVGGAVGFGVMLLVYVLGVMLVKFISARRGQPVGLDGDAEAIGFGDVNLSGVIGLLMGWPAVTTALLFAVVIGGAVSLLYLLWKIITRRYHANLALPYGPFLVAGALLPLFFKPLLLAVFF